MNCTPRYLRVDELLKGSTKTSIQEEVDKLRRDEQEYLGPTPFKDTIAGRQSSQWSVLLEEIAG